MNRSSGFPVRITDPIELSFSSESRRSSSSTTMSRFMKLSGGLSNRTVSTRPARSVSNVRAIWLLLLGLIRLVVQGPERVAHRLGDPPVNLDVASAIDRDLDHRGALPRAVFELVEALDSNVGQAIERGDACRFQPERCSQQGLELLALHLLGLGQELEDPASVVVEDDYPHIGARLTQRGQSVHVVVQAQVAGDDPDGVAARRRGADPRGDQP